MGQVCRGKGPFGKTTCLEPSPWATIFTRVASERFDVAPQFDETRAVEPLERAAAWVNGEPPVMYPSGV